MFAPLITSAAEASTSGEISKWIVGGIVLGLFLVAMLVLLTIGGGREHT